MNDRRTAASLVKRRTVAVIALAALFELLAIYFASRQSVWTDEATQLGGLSLGFMDQLRWLKGDLAHAFDVPLDRTPPLSYWLGSVWIRAFGDAVPTLRCLSVFLLRFSPYIRSPGDFSMVAPH